MMTSFKVWQVPTLYGPLVNFSVGCGDAAKAGVAIAAAAGGQSMSCPSRGCGDAASQFPELALKFPKIECTFSPAEFSAR